MRDTVKKGSHDGCRAVLYVFAGLPHCGWHELIACLWVVMCGKLRGFMKTMTDMSPALG